MKLQFVSCHRLPERSFFFKGKQFPLCARCTGLYAGFLVLPIFVFGLLFINFWWTILLIAPTIIDGLLQAHTKYFSNNPIRFITGTMAGIGFMSMTSIAAEYLAQIIKPIIF